MTIVSWFEASLWPSAGPGTRLAVASGLCSFFSLSLSLFLEPEEWWEEKCARCFLFAAAPVALIVAPGVFSGRTLALADTEEKGTGDGDIYSRMKFRLKTIGSIFREERERENELLLIVQVIPEIPTEDFLYY